MCPTGIWPAAICLIAGVAFIAFLVRMDAWRETNRRRRLMDESLTRYEQAQNRWVESPHVELERRG